MNRILNPYKSGPPVYGEDFYGREKEILQVLDTDVKLTLFIATRRMGKTSLCKQIRYICENRPEYNYNLCASWDLQGAYDISTARETLTDYENQKTLSKVDWAKIEKAECHEVIKDFCGSYQGLPEKKTVFLLLDEPEAFIRFMEDRKYKFLTNLKRAFDSIPNLRVVMVSPPRILNLFACSEIPCLLDDFQLYYLRELSDKEAIDLIHLRQKKNPAPLNFLENEQQVIKDIIEVSNRAPFYIQEICRNIFDEYPERNPAQVMEDIITRQTFSPFFKSDFIEVHTIQKIMLLILVHAHEPLDSQVLIKETKKVATTIKGKIPTQKYVDDLVFLGLLKEFGEKKYHFSNGLFDRWILRDFENLWAETMKDIDVKKPFNKPVLTPGSLKRKDLEEIKAEVDAFKDVLKKLDKDHEDGTVKDEFYFKRRISLVRDQGLLIKKLQDHLVAYEANSLYEVLEQIKQSSDDTVIDQKLRVAEQEGQTKGWGGIVTTLSGDHNINRVQVALEAAFRVADYLIQAHN